MAQEVSDRPDSPLLPSVSSPTVPAQPPRESLLDAAINQLLKEQPSVGDSSYNSANREQQDMSLLRNVQSKCDSGDTLIIVNFPTGYVNCKWEEWSPKRFCVDSEKLLGTGSKVFAKLLSPEGQARIKKRIEYAGQPSPQKFVIDLTPSVEGEELAAQLIELSLPPGVRDWWMSMERLGVSRYLVSGHDDHCPRHNEVPITCKTNDNYIEYDPVRGEDLPRLDLADVLTPQSRAIDDYCPIRHRANIVRLMLAIQGYDLVLNSASRVYTLTGIANILDCTGIIGDSVCTWLMAEPNSEFIDINTESALKIAWTLELANVTRAAFRILVVEKAFDTLATGPRAPEAQHTIFGRPRIDLPDDLQTVIEYAAQKLADRVQQTLANLRSDRFYSLLEIKEYQKLVKTGDLISSALSSTPVLSTFMIVSDADILRREHLNHLSTVFTTLFTRLHKYKELIVQEAMASPPNNDQQRHFDRDRRCYVPSTNWDPTIHIYSKFSDAQHLLTSFFWDALASYPRSYSGMVCPENFLGWCVNDFNSQIDKAFQYLRPETGVDPEALRFDLPTFCNELHQAMDEQWMIWTKPDLEAPFSRTKHFILALSDDEFKYLPLWAGGLDDGTGGVFEPALPDADLGPIGPGPAYRTGDTIGTDASSICQSDKTPSQGSTATLTAGRSIAAIHSNTVPSTVHDGVSVEGSHPMSSSSVVMVDATDEMDTDNDDAYEFDDSDEISDEAWSQVEEP
ncbi:hypothetical protein F4804DRAFT_160699 [Jackrogersella minutella]|nr:hypothetical protein F4804DRAFT_160699 [Jackrogersella minutella]